MCSGKRFVFRKEVRIPERLERCQGHRVALSCSKRGALGAALTTTALTAALATGFDDGLDN